MDKIGLALLLALLAVCWLCFSRSARDDILTENMAPLNWGTYPNNYPRGRCDKKLTKRTPCEIGTCPLGTTVSDDTFCKIQCAQDPDPQTRKECYDYCVGMVKHC